DFAALSWGTLPAPSYNNVAISDTNGQIYWYNLATGMWQHSDWVWDRTYKHWYVNGFDVRSEVVATGVNIGTMGRLVFGADENPNNGAIGAGPRFGRTRLDEI